MNAQPGAARTWSAPGALAVATVVGLLSALLADGAGDVVSWIALGAPVAAAAWCAGRRG